MGRFLNWLGERAEKSAERADKAVEGTAQNLDRGLARGAENLDRAADKAADRATGWASKLGEAPPKGGFAWGSVSDAEEKKGDGFSWW